MNTPTINVTPLIDVLLVLLIIFMVVTPLKPRSFKVRIPVERAHKDPVTTPPDTLIVTVGTDASLTLNNESQMGSVIDPAPLIERLRRVFNDRNVNGSVSASFANDADRPVQDRVERTVFIKAPRATNYGNVAKVVDAVKLAGAYPISLQIDDLN